MTAKPETDAGPAPPLWRPQKSEEPSKAELGREYAKRVPRPRQRPVAIAVGDEG